MKVTIYTQSTLEKLSLLVCCDIPQGRIFIGEKCSFLAGMCLELLCNLWFKFIFGSNPVINLDSNGLPGIISFALSLPILYRNLTAENKLQ